MYHDVVIIIIIMNLTIIAGCCLCTLVDHIN
jgi:hypothetical protein